MESVNGTSFKLLLLSSFNNLKKYEDVINELNVFPVPDGDTGTNMRLTLEYGITNAIDNESIGKYMQSLSYYMLMGSRGNSGVILSQIFRGIAKGVKNLDIADSRSLIDAVVLGYQTAYKAVRSPVEGSILTVCRLGIENIKDNNYLDIESFLLAFSKSMKKVLDDTPNMLQVLKDANVIDSGGAGLYAIFDGMLAYFSENTTTEIASNNRRKLKFKRSDEHKLVSYIAVSNGEGIRTLYEDLGVDFIIDTDRSMSVAASDIIEAIECSNSYYVVILPNNKNNILACEQATSMVKRDGCFILNTKSLIDGYYAMSMVDLTSPDFELQLKNAKKGLANIDRIEITKAIKDTSINGIDFKKGEYVTLVNDMVISSNSNIFDAIKMGFKEIDLSSKEAIAVLYGKELDDDSRDEVSSFMFVEYDTLEIGEVYGDQANYDLIIGIS